MLGKSIKELVIKWTKKVEGVTDYANQDYILTCDIYVGLITSVWLKREANGQISNPYIEFNLGAIVFPRNL